MAHDLARQAERAYHFEFGASDSYISFGNWDSRRKGLLAGEALQLDLLRLEKSAMAQNSRYLEIEKTISLARLDPLALMQLKQTGSCQFSLDELLFDRDYPGHYFRVIKSLAITIPAVVGPYQTLRATLTQTGHKTLLEPDIAGVEYLLGERRDIPSSVRADWRSNQQIAISRGVEDSGMFELSFSDDRYLPFENTGVVSTWLLEMPRENNPIDYDTIADVIVHLRYMCKTDGSFRQSVRDLPAYRAYQGVRLFSVADEFAAQWHAFTRGASTALELALPPGTFPHNVDVDLGGAVVQVVGVAADGSARDVTAQFKSREILAGRPPRIKLAGGSRVKAENLLLLLSYSGALRE
jgi:hypothetical protein